MEFIFCHPWLIVIATNINWKQLTFVFKWTSVTVVNKNMFLGLQLCIMRNSESTNVILKRNKQFITSSYYNLWWMSKNSVSNIKITFHAFLKWYYDQKIISFFSSDLKEYSLNIHLPKFWALRFIRRLFILSVSFGFDGAPLLTFKTDR